MEYWLDSVDAALNAGLRLMPAVATLDKLELRSGEEKLSRTLILDAIMGIQDGQNPRVIQSMLQNYLNQSKRNTGTE